MLWEQIEALIAKEPSCVKLLKNSKGELECIFIQTSYMRKWFLDFHEIHNIDSTFKVNVENFQLYISMVHNEHGKGVPSAYCFMKSACKENIEFFYQNVTGKILKTAENGDVIENILDEELAASTPGVNQIDKDLTNIDLFQKNGSRFL